MTIDRPATEVWTYDGGERPVVALSAMGMPRNGGCNACGFWGGVHLNYDAAEARRVAAELLKAADGLEKLAAGRFWPNGSHPAPDRDWIRWEQDKEARLLDAAHHHGVDD